jgi:MoxR-like ATPase
MTGDDILHAQRLVRRIPVSDQTYQFALQLTRAALDGRKIASVDDVRHMAHPVLRHRLLTNFTADSQNIRPSQIIDRLIAEIGEASGTG